MKRILISVCLIILVSEHKQQELSLPSKLSERQLTFFSDFQRTLQDVKLFPSEISSLFNLIDKEHEGRINQRDWQYFYSQFILPFQTDCDKDKDYIINEKEIPDCLKSEKLQDLPEELQDQKKHNLTAMLNKRELNFNDYVLLRRVNLGWSECSYGGSMSRLQLGCGLNVLVPVRSVSMGESQQMFQLATLFHSAKVTNSQRPVHLDFITFLSLAHVYTLFDQFDNPIKDGSINKYDLLKQINYQRMPIFMSYETVQQIFMSYDPDTKLDLPIHLQLIDYEKRMQRISSKDDSKIDFIVFCTYFTLHKYFNQFSQEKTGYLSLKEFQELFKDINVVPQAMLDVINGLQFPEVDLTKEQPPAEGEPPAAGDKVTQQQKSQNIKSDREFFLRSYLQIHQTVRFKLNKHNTSPLQKQQKETSLFKNLFQFQQKKSSAKAQKKAGGENSEKIFKLFDSNNKGEMEFLDLIRLFKYTWMFMNYDLDDAGFLNEQKVEAGQFAFVSPIPINQAESQLLEKISDQNTLYKFVDLKLFYSMFLKNMCFYDDSLNVVENQQQIHKEAVITGLTKMGLSLFKEQAEASLDGADDLGVEQYNKNKVYQLALQNERTLIVEAVKKKKEEAKK